MQAEPIISITVLFTSIKLAVVAVITAVAVSLQWDETMTAAIIGAGAAITVAVGDLLAAYLTRERVTPVAAPNGLVMGSLVNVDSDSLPTGVVVEETLA